MLSQLKESFILPLGNYKLVNYLDFTKEELLEILDIRNNEFIRRKMVDDSIISKENHFKFVESLKMKNEGYWGLKDGNKIVGSISLVKYDFNDNSFIGGNFIIPKLIGSGFGIVINYFMYYLAFEILKCDKIKALVKKDNINAIRLNKFFEPSFMGKFNNEDEYLALEFLMQKWNSSTKLKIEKNIKYVI